MDKCKNKANLWLKTRCDRLSIKQRKIIVYGICIIYLFCSCVILWQLFHHKEDTFPIPQGQLLDTPLQQKTSQNNITINHYGNQTERTA